MDLKIQEYCSLLGLSIDFSKEELTRAYRDLVKVWHPDRFCADPGLQLKAQESLKRINAAYEYLSERINTRRTTAWAEPQATGEPEPRSEAEAKAEPEPKADAGPVPPREPDAPAGAMTASKRTGTSYVWQWWIVGFIVVQSVRAIIHSNAKQPPVPQPATVIEQPVTGSLDSMPNEVEFYRLAKSDDSVRVRSLFARANPRYSAKDKIKFGMELGAAILESYGPYTSDQSIVDLAKATVEVFSEMKNTNADFCSALTSAISGKPVEEKTDERIPLSIRAKVDRVYKAYCDVMRDAKSHPQAAPETKKVERLLMPVMKGVEKDFDRDSGNLCDFVILLNSRILALPERERSIVLRGMSAQHQSWSVQE